jgi:hypothetical protein
LVWPPSAFYHRPKVASWFGRRRPFTIDPKWLLGLAAVGLLPSTQSGFLVWPPSAFYR